MAFALENLIQVKIIGSDYDVPVDSDSDRLLCQYISNPPNENSSLIRDLGELTPGKRRIFSVIIPDCTVNSVVVKEV